MGPRLIIKEEVRGVLLIYAVQGGYMFTKPIPTLVCLAIVFTHMCIQGSAIPNIQDIARAIGSSCALRGLAYGVATIAPSSAVGYTLGALAPRKTVMIPSNLAAVCGAVYAGTFSACTIAPYIAYKKGKLPGLIAYSTSLALIVCSDYYLASKKRKEFDEATQLMYRSAYLEQIAIHDSPQISSAPPSEISPHELCYRLAKILLAENLGR